MNRLDKEILKSILTAKKSIYEINENIKDSNYATVWRHIKKLQKDGLLSISEAQRKNGKPDKRNTILPTLTDKGIATLLIDADLSKDELMKINEKIFQEDFAKILNKKSFVMLKPVVAEVFSKSLLEIRSKINLKFFDEKWFNYIYNKTLTKNVGQAIGKNRDEFVKAGVWLSKEEAQREAQEFQKLVEILVKKKSKVSEGE